jgi:hypothetical protein
MTAPNYYVPSQQVILEIVKGLSTTIVTENPHGFLTGQTVRIEIPTITYNNTVQKIAENVGMQQLNGFLGEITVIDDYTFSVAVDSRQYDDYIGFLSPVSATSIGQAIPVSEPADTLDGATKNNNNILPETIGTIPINS